MKPAFTLKCFGEQLLIFHAMREQNLLRRRLVIVELRQERTQHLFRRQRFVGTREIGAVAPVLSGPEEEDFDAAVSTFLMESEHIGLFHGAWIDALLRLNRRQRSKTITVKRRTLEFEVVRRLLHLGCEQFLHRAAAPGQKVSRFTDQFRIAGKIDLAWCRDRRSA